MSEPERGSPLEQRLDEGPIPHVDLWDLYWGRTRDGRSVILRQLTRVLTSEGTGAHVLIAGRYGCGKTSLVDALLDSLGELPGAPLPIKLNMPLITAHSGTSAVAAVIGAIVEHLCGDPPQRSKHWKHWTRPNDGLCRDLKNALEDLWLREAGFESDGEPRAELEGPRPNRLAGSPTQVSTRVFRANVIEQYIDTCLGYGTAGEPGSREPPRLIVVLDDVDRCRRQVPVAIIRLLLRFGTSRGVRFVVTSDRELMARGVEEWMKANGTDDDGQVFVTANSALEKYLSLMVDVPTLDDEAHEDEGVPTLDLGDPPLRLLGSFPVFDWFDEDQRGESQPILRPWTGENRPPSLADYLITWMLSVVEERDLLSPAYVTRPADAAPRPAPARKDPPPAGAGQAQSRDLPFDIPAAASTPGADNEAKSPAGAASGEAIDDKERSKLYNVPEGIGLKAEREGEKPSPKPLLPKPSDFAIGLRALVELDDRNKIVRLRPPYEHLIRSLTPRQLKFFLRALRSGTIRSGRSPAATLLKQVFFGFYRLRTDEGHLFRFAAASAAAARAAAQARAGSGDTASGDRVREGSQELALCFAQIRAIAEASTVLRGEALRQAWPVQREEQVLLVHLLAVVAEEDALRENAIRASLQPTRTEGSVKLRGGYDREFAEWAEERLGKKPDGDLVADQVSSFQDKALEADRRGKPPGIASIVAEYAERFLDRQAPFLARRTSISLSNLAVMIEGVEPYEAQCDRLFAEAVKLDPQHGGIPLYYADFLATVAGVPTRRARLVPARYANQDDLLRGAETLIAKAPAADARSRFYGATIGLRISKARGTPRDALVERLDTLVEAQLGLFVDAARDGDSEPVARLDSALDAVLGTTAADLAQKGPIFGLIWGVLERCGQPVWTVVQSLAFNLVAQSGNLSPEESHGARMNLALLADTDLIAKRADQAARVWTETLAVWSRRAAGAGSPTIRARAALGLLAALVYGGGREWATRATAIWAACGGTGEADPETLKRALDARQEDLLAALERDREHPQAVRDAVFRTDLGAPIVSIETLAEEENWPLWSTLSARIEDLARRLCGDQRTGPSSDRPPPAPAAHAGAAESPGGTPPATTGPYAARSPDQAPKVLPSQAPGERERLFGSKPGPNKAQPAGTPEPATPPPLTGGPDPEFADWVKAQLRKTLAAVPVADQVASFQDAALEADRRGETGIAAIVAEYAEQFLVRQAPFLAQRTAASLSNLAVMIEGTEGLEPQCNRLFDAAVSLNPEHSDIPLYYAEFLARVADAPKRLERLVSKRYPDQRAILDRAAELVGNRTGADDKGGFYAETITLLIAKAQGVGKDALARSLGELVRGRMGLFVEAARRGDTEPIARLDASMDAVLGVDPAELPNKARALGLIWGVLGRCRLPTWPIAQVLANDLVGESATDSPEETLGLRINLWLLSNPPGSAAPTYPVAPIWTQTLAVWSRRAADGGSEARRDRAVLGLLAALVYGGGPGWATRADAVWRRLGGTGTVDPQAWWSLLPPERQALITRLQEEPASAKDVVNAVFDSDLGDAIDSVETLAAQAQWPDWPDLAPDIAKLAAQHCPDSGGSAHD